MNSPPNGGNFIENVINSPPKRTLAIKFVKQPLKATEHYFIASNSADNITIDEIATIDPIVENPKSIITFLTLPTTTPRAMSRRWDPIMDFTKSLILTLDEYVNAVLEVRCVRLAMVAEKERN